MNVKRPAKIPAAPGVYFFKNRRGEMLYIGKAANLRGRLGSYFIKTGRDPRIAKMLAEAGKITWQKTDSEIEALILEGQLIKKYKTPYNISLRDDKQYAYAAFTREGFPKVYVTHQPTDSTDNFGPFVEAGALRKTLKLLRKNFPFCTCRQLHYRHCLNYHIGKCPGFCCLKTAEGQETRAEGRKYRGNIKAIKDILSGKKIALIRQLKKEARQAGRAGDFEKAIDLRTKIEKLEKVFRNARVIKDISKKPDPILLLKRSLNLANEIKRIEGYDISNIQGRHAVGAMVVFENGQANRSEYRKFKIRSINKAGDPAMFGEILSRRFSHPEWPKPDLIIVDGGKAQFGVVRQAISNSEFLISKEIPIIALTKNDRHKGDHIFVSNQKTPIKVENLPAAARNLILEIDAEAHRFAINYHRKLHRAGFAKK